MPALLLFLALGSATNCAGLLRSTLPEAYQKTDQVGRFLPPFEVLGPIASVAVSPFYGMALLSGAALLSDRGLLPRNEFLRRSRVLKNPLFFGCFALLALLISLPRFTKITNSLGTVLGYLEDRAALICLLVLNVLVVLDSSLFETTQERGWQTIAWESALSVLAIVNFFVLRTVRFYVDLMIFISPLPFVDAALEMAKKVGSTVLLVLYAYFPGAAAGFTLLWFALSMLFVFQILRLTKFYISVLLRPMFARARSVLWSGKQPRRARPPWRLGSVARGRDWMAVFPLRRFGRVGAKARLFLVWDNDTVRLFRSGLFGRRSWALLPGDARFSLGRSLLYNQLLIEFADGEKLELAFSNLDSAYYPELIARLGALDRGPLGIKAGLDRIRAGIRPKTV